MAPTNNAVHTEQIVKDITSTTLCSYQIAHKYSLTKMTVDRIARTHLRVTVNFSVLSQIQFS